MDVIPADNTLEDIQPVSDDIEERLERLRNRELLPASVLIELCDKVYSFVLRLLIGKRDHPKGAEHSNCAMSRYGMWRYPWPVL